MEIKLGERAPLFSLYDHTLHEVRLEQFRGKKVVLLFFPLVFSRVCTEELCMMRDCLLDEYKKRDAEILAISVDSPFALAKFHEEEHLTFPLLSDFNKEVSRSYGTLYEEYKLGLRGISKRSVFIIDKFGILMYKEVMDDPRNMPNFDRVKDTLSKQNVL